MTGTLDATRSRRDLYRFLAGVFLAPPDEAALEEVCRKETLDELAGVYGEAAVAPLRGLSPDAKEAGAEFDQLFKVPLNGFVPPYESVHRDRGESGEEKARLFGSSCRAVADLMTEAGAKLPEDIGEPPDHVGVEFLFLSFLCDREREAREEGDPDQLERWLGREALFLRDHLGSWFAAFGDEIALRAPGGFYAAIGSLAREVLAADVAGLTGA